MLLKFYPGDPLRGGRGDGEVSAGIGQKNRIDVAAWHTTYLHWQTEELEIRYPGWMAPETARTIIQELLAAERIPVKGPEREPTGRAEIPSVFRRLWQGVHTRPEGTYVVGVHGDLWLIDRLAPEWLGGGAPNEPGGVGG